jgi:hypothetical protein
MVSIDPNGVGGKEDVIAGFPQSFISLYPCLPPEIGYFYYLVVLADFLKQSG